MSYAIKDGVVILNKTGKPDQQVIQEHKEQEANAAEEIVAKNLEREASGAVLAWAALQPSAPKEIVDMAKAANEARGRKK